ncbi:MAG: hypothetical protein D3923_03835 [Candidatus Electrothrix sp. AR3]|nr:hypothetical protein [Candidatus Electrothrix sp. AR3]
MPITERRIMHLIFRLLAVILVIGWASGQRRALAAPSPFTKLIQNGGYGVSDLRGKIIAGYNVDRPYVPASILKISTALAALAILGPDYRFKTRFYTDSKENLYIMGFGDPRLISEEITLILSILKKQGLKRINAIYVDTSRFALEHQVPGSEFSGNAYDAPVGPVVVNFNSVPVRVSKRKKHRITSGEAQTPVLPLMEELAKGAGPGRYRINICKGGCQVEQQMARYTVELFRALQRELGIPGKGKTGIKSVPQHAKFFYEHKNTKNLEEMTSSFLKYSSNFIANLIYLACGAEKFGYPATWRKAERAVQQELVKRLGSTTAAAIFHKEGAGLSRGNRVTVRAMLEVLRVFRPYAYLLRKHLGLPGKSGSMKGIYNYAGYLDNGNPYVIMLNQTRNQRRAVLELLKKGQYLPQKKKLSKK